MKQNAGKTNPVDLSIEVFNSQFRIVRMHHNELNTDKFVYVNERDQKTVKTDTFRKAFKCLVKDFPYESYQLFNPALYEQEANEVRGEVLFNLIKDSVLKDTPYTSLLEVLPTSRVLYAETEGENVLKVKLREDNETVIYWKFEDGKDGEKVTNLEHFMTYVIGKL